MSKYYVITETGVHVYPSKLQLNREVKLDTHEFVKLGNDNVVYMTDHAFEIVKDIKMLETVASRKVFSKDHLDLTGWLQIISLLFVFLIYSKL